MPRGCPTFQLPVFLLRRCVGSLSQCDRNSRTTRHTEDVSGLIYKVSSVKEGDCWFPLRFFRCKALTTHQLSMPRRVTVAVALPQQPVGSYGLDPALRSNQRGCRRSLQQEPNGAPTAEPDLPPPGPSYPAQ